MHVRKIYVRDEAGGASTRYWEQIWRRADEVEAMSVSAPFAALLDEHLPEGLVLESGCGTAGVVEWLDDRGRRAVGVDLAREALIRAKHRRPEDRLAVADITRLPFADGTFDALVSLGVVEHFENGPQPVLREQRRVLRSGGTLFLTVPRVSWYRWATDVRYLTIGRQVAYEQRGRLVTRRMQLEEDEGPGAFHQYELPRRTICDLVADAGFVITASLPTGVAHATADGPALRHIARLAGQAPASNAGATGLVTDAGEVSAAGIVDRAKRAARNATVGEAGEGVIGGSVTRLTRHAIGHLQLVVARAV